MMNPHGWTGHATPATATVGSDSDETDVWASTRALFLSSMHPRGRVIRLDVLSDQSRRRKIDANALFAMAGFRKTTSGRRRLEAHWSRPAPGSTDNAVNPNLVPQGGIADARSASTSPNLFGVY